MLVVSNKRLVPVQINTTILQGDDGNYYYLHRDLYDQLVILADSYDNGERLDLLIKTLVGEDKALPENLQRFYDTVPLPLKLAAPFLLQVKGCEDLDTIEDMCGALTVISMSVNLRRILKVDKSLRAAATFSLHVREEYRTHWDRFFQENPEFGAAVTLPATQQANKFIPTPQGTTIIQDAETGEEQEVTFTTPIEDFDFEALMGDLVAEATEEAALSGAPTGDSGGAAPSSAAQDDKDSWAALDGI